MAEHIRHVSDFDHLAEEFDRRVRETIWANAATVDARGRPRSRVVHPVWDGPVGWITSRRSPKVAHLGRHPHVSIAYVADPTRPVYAECAARWVDDLDTVSSVWERCRREPEPYGFDPEAVWGPPGRDVGAIRLDAWRIDVSDFSGPPLSLVWQGAGVARP